MTILIVTFALLGAFLSLLISIDDQAADAVETARVRRFEEP